MMSALKDGLRAFATRVSGLPVVQEYAHRAVYLHRFHAWKATHPCPRFLTRYELYEHVVQLEGLDAPIDYLEFGVYQGASMRWWLSHVGHPDARFAGFDSFEGLPEDWGKNYMPRGTFSTEGEVPVVDDARCAFVRGWFQHTLDDFMKAHPLTRRLVVHLDADLFSSTLYVLTRLGPLLKRGDVLVFDEFHDYMDEFRAYQQFEIAYGRQTSILGMSSKWSQVALKVL